MENLSVRIKLTVIVICTLIGETTAKPHRPVKGNDEKLSSAKQLMVVVTHGWDDLRGRIFCFEKHKNKWTLQFSNPIVVGSKGLGVGHGIIAFAITGAPLKKEGDNKSPAGIFTIGTAFGYAGYQDASWIKAHYIKASDTLICVDDAQSANYNRLVQKDTAKQDYKSHEEMHLKADYYKWGLFINHNADDVVPGGGSCIFMHIWGNSREGTAGCTAMQEGNILRVLHWIDARKMPLLVQFPAGEYRKIHAFYHLPAVNFK
jgi:L,D-peptidoglycan transpeptidase YkuD (ErfK/YbiS/YcfS/YnhG family)